MGIKGLDALINPGSTPSYWALYHRYGSELREWFPNAKEAWDFLQNGANKGELASDGIEYPDGTIVLSPLRGGDEGLWMLVGRGE